VALEGRFSSAPQTNEAVVGVTGGCTYDPSRCTLQVPERTETTHGVSLDPTSFSDPGGSAEPCYFLPDIWIVITTSV
jgi:hypothetical protein